jgi:signal transduction histidine kinase
MRKIYIGFFCFFCLLSSVYSNDTLQAISQNAKTIPTIDALNRGLLAVLESKYLPTDLQGVPTEYLQYAEKSLQLSGNLKYQKGETEALLAIGLYYWHLGLNYQSGIDQKPFTYLERASAIAKNTNNVAIEAKVNRAIGKIYVELGELQLGLKTLLESYEMVKNQFYVTTDLGNIHFDTGEYLKALQKFLDALVIARSENDNHRVAYALHNVAKAFDKLARRAKAIGTLDEGVAIAEKNKDLFALALLYNTYGSINFRLDETQKAIKYYEQALEMSNKIDNKRLKADILQNFAQLYNREKDYKKALSFYQEALPIYEKYVPKIRLLDVYADLSDIYAYNKDYQKALYYFKLHTDLKTQYFSEENQKELLAEEAQSNERKIEVLEKANKLAESELKLQRLFKNMALGLALMTLLGIIFMFYIFRQKQKTNRSLQKQKEELKQANLLKDRMFAVISQDFRNPLNSLRSLVTLLNSGALNAQEIKLISEKLNDDLGTTLGLLDNLLFWAGSQMQGIKRETVAVDIYQLVSENLNLLSSNMSKKNIILQNTISPTFTKALANPHTVSLVIRSLLTNAIKFSPRNTPIVLSAKNNGEMIEVSITDSGRIVSYENQQKIFNTDAILDHSGASMEKGSGVDLLLCKEFIEENGGKIWVKGEEGRGSTFSFSLRAANPHN